MAAAREQIVQTAEKYVARGKIEPAIREYRKLLSDNPNDINTLNRIGDLYARIQRVDEAIDFFTQIAERYTEEGFFVKAIAIYKKIIKLNPTVLEVYEKLAELYAKQGLTNEARTQFQVLADYYQKHDNAASAIAIYNRLVDLEPENPSHHVKLAEIYQQQLLYEKALGEYRTIAELMLETGHVPQAAQVYERALAIDDRNIPFLTDAVLKLRQAGGTSAAARFLALAVERNPDAERIGRLIGLEDTGVREVPRFEARPEAPHAEPSAGRSGDTTVPALPEEPAASAQPFSLDLDLDVEEETPAFAAPAEPAARQEAREEPDEIELDLDEVFVLEMEEDAEPSSLVKPPPDMLQGEPRRPAWALQAETETQPEAPVEAAPPPPLAPPPAAEPAAEEGEASWSEIADLGFEGLPSLEPLVDPFQDLFPLEAPSVGRPTASSRGVRLDAEALEQTADGLHHPARDHDEDLVTEAEVLARYGLDEKALERLEEALRTRPDNLEAHALGIQIHLDRGRLEPAAEAARAMARAVAGRPSEIWDLTRQKLASAGVRIEQERRPARPQPQRPVPAVELPFVELAKSPLDDELPAVEPPAPLDVELPAPAAASPVAPVVPIPLSPAQSKASRSLDREVAALLGTAKARKPAAPSTQPIAAPKAPQPPAPPPMVATESPAVEAAPPEIAPPPQAVPPPFAPPPQPGTVLFDPRAIAASLEDIDDQDFVVPGLREPMAPLPPPEAESPASLDDTSMSWLDEAEAVRASAASASSQPPAPGSGLFSEDDFFDLAGELDQELEREVGGGDLLAGPAEQTLEEIVEGFKKGVSENLSATDYETHFNLGIAYREMGLIDEAIGEFQLSAKDPAHLVACCSNLGLCFLEKGLPELAVKWYRRGLESPDLSEEDSLGLQYDTGCAYVAMGDSESAYKSFVDLYGINSNYRDVVARIEELGHPH